MRIASVQHGDFLYASSIEAGDEPEPYFGMKYSVRFTKDLFRQHSCLIISLNAPVYRETVAGQPVIGLPSPPRRRFPGAGVWAAWSWSRALLREVRDFRPDRLLLRAGSAWVLNPLLGYAAARNIPVLVLMANTLPAREGGAVSRFNRKRMIQLLNRPNVYKVGNHRVVAARSLERAGVDPAKVVSYDFPGAKQPDDFPVKSAPQPGEPIRLVYAGVLSADKGVQELLSAVQLLEERGVSCSLRVFGAGALEDEVAAAGRGRPSVVAEGRRGNAEVFEAMRDAHIVVVPSRHCFAEGLPFTLTEALASRTPVVCSDHPVFREAFTDGEGVVFFPERRAEQLADAIVGVAGDPERYRRLSETTAAAFARVSSETMAGDLVTEWLAKAR